MLCQKLSVLQAILLKQMLVGRVAPCNVADVEYCLTVSSPPIPHLHPLALKLSFWTEKNIFKEL